MIINKARTIVLAFAASSSSCFFFFLHLLPPSRKENNIKNLSAFQRHQMIEHVATTNENPRAGISYQEIILIFNRALALGEQRGIEVGDLSLGLVAFISIAH
jgi:hypothetical protein